MNVCPLCENNLAALMYKDIRGYQFAWNHPSGEPVRSQWWYCPHCDECFRIRKMIVPCPVCTTLMSIFGMGDCLGTLLCWCPKCVAYKEVKVDLATRLIEGLRHGEGSPRTGNSN